MSTTELLKKTVEDTFAATAGLVGLVEEADLAWKPAAGGNWMTTGQLLKHIETACGSVAGCFVTGDWSIMATFEEEMVEGVERDPSTGMYPAEAMPTSAGTAATLAALEKDKAAVLAAIDEAGEERLNGEDGAAPWNPTPRKLGYNLLECVLHLATHKAQLFYYLKLQGKPVHTGHLWGM